MILLRPDCLVFKDADGECVPCSVHEVTVELLGNSAHVLDYGLLEHAAEAVLHFFKTEKGQNSVSVIEFSEALERVLRGLGYEVRSEPCEPASPKEEPDAEIVETDLQELADAEGQGCELLFFPRLRDRLRCQLKGTGAPPVLRFCRLRACVKQLAGARRWTPHCQKLNDQIIHFLRSCLTAENNGSGCLLVVK